MLKQISYNMKDKVRQEMFDNKNLSSFFVFKKKNGVLKKYILVVFYYFLKTILRNYYINM